MKTADMIIVPHEIKIKMSCGTDINVTTWPNQSASSDVCVLLHGLDNSSRLWDVLAQELGQHMTVYAPDLRGHGNSDWCHAFHYSRARLVEDIEEIRLALGIESMSLVGHSLGASIACSYANKNPEMVSALVLGDLGLDTNAAVLENMVATIENRNVCFEREEDFISHMQNSYFMSDPGVLADFARKSVRLVDNAFVSKTDPACVKAFADELIRVSCVRDTQPQSVSLLWRILNKIEAPMLVLKGEYSSVLSLGTARRLIADKSNRKLEVVPKSGHAIFLDNPGVSNRATGEYLHGIARKNLHTAFVKSA